MFDPLLSPAWQPFPSDYRQARLKLMNLLEKQTNSLEHEAIRHQALGVSGENLFTDIVWLGRKDAENVLFLISATHGVEGFAGSAIQHDVLQQLVQTTLPRQLAVVIIHALNAWGFSYQRRVNEDGVDLNRNAFDFTPPCQNHRITTSLPRCWYLLMAIGKRRIRAYSNTTIHGANNASGRLSPRGSINIPRDCFTVDNPPAFPAS